MLEAGNTPTRKWITRFLRRLQHISGVFFGTVRSFLRRCIKFIIKSKKRFLLACLSAILLIALVFYFMTNSSHANRCIVIDNNVLKHYKDVDQLNLGTNQHKKRNDCTTLLKKENEESFLVILPVKNKLEPLTNIRTSIETDFALGGASGNYLKNIQNVSTDSGTITIASVTTSDNSLMQYALLKTKKQYEISPIDSDSETRFTTDQFLIITSAPANIFQQIDYNNIRTR